VHEATAAEPRITVQVRLFASYREAAGTGRLEAPLPVGARVRDLIDQLEPRLPALRRAPGLVAVNQTYVGPDFELHAGNEVAFIPPVSGGAPDGASMYIEHV
jgi:molybdopterin synthase catalytic subunit